MRRSPGFTFWLRAYVIVALVGAALVTPLLQLPLPLVLALGYVAGWRWPLSRTGVLLTDYFIYFTLPLLFQTTLGVWCLVVALPLLPASLTAPIPSTSRIEARRKEKQWVELR